MSVDANVAMPFGSKNLVELSKNNTEVNKLLFTILRAIENLGAYKSIGRELGISHCMIYCHELVLFDVSSITFYHLLFSLHGLR